MRSLWNLFLRSRDGSVAIIAALAIIPMTLLIGAGVDYGMAADRQAQLEGYADAAALSAVTPTMMTENNSQAQAVAQNSFNAQASTLTQVTYNTSDVTATVTTTPGNVRTATVSYSVPYNTFFASITLNVGGRELEIDSRPSDAIALAVRSGAPIYAAEEVISESAIEFEHDVEESEDVVEKFKEFLDQVSPEDFAAGDS